MNKFKVVKSMLMNLPVSLTMSFVAQGVNILHGHMQHFEWGTLCAKKMRIGQSVRSAKTGLWDKDMSRSLLRKGKTPDKL